MKLIPFLLLMLCFVLISCQRQDETEESSFPWIPSDPLEPEFSVTVIIRDAATQQSIAGASIYINGVSVERQTRMAGCLV